MKALVLFFVCSVNAAFAQLNFHYSNKDGELALVLDTGFSGEVKDAVSGLKTAIEKTLDAKCMLVTVQTEAKPHAFLFETGNTTLPDGECFGIKLIDEKTVLFYGYEDQSLVNAVNYFMETELQYNWLYPDSSFICYGKLKKLYLADYNVTDCPAFRHRELSPLDASRNNVWGNWARANGLNSRIEFHHAFNELMNTPEFIDKNPGFFPVVKGKRYLPNNKADYNWQPDFQAKGFPDTIASMLMGKLQKDKKIHSFSLSMNDSGNFDETREKGKKKELNFLKKEDYSDEFYSWANQVAEKVNATHPDVKFGVLAYSNLIEPPSIKVNRNIIPFITYDRMRWMNTELKKTDQDLSTEWAAKVPEIAWYDYVYGSYYLVPRLYSETMQEYLKWGRDNKVKYYYAESYPNIGEGPKLWILSKLLRNPDCNIDSLNRAWCRNVFGSKAAKYMVKYFENWETFWKNMEDEAWLVNTSQYLPFTDLAYLRRLDETFLNANQDLVNKALKKSKTAFHKRNAGIYSDLNKSYMGFLKMMSEIRSEETNIKNAKDNPAFIRELESFLKIYDNEKNYKILTSLLNRGR